MTEQDTPADGTDFTHEELDDDYGSTDPLESMSLPVVPKPINWHILRSHEAEEEWMDLNQWVNQLRET